MLFAAFIDDILPFAPILGVLFVVLLVILFPKWGPGRTFREAQAAGKASAERNPLLQKIVSAAVVLAVVGYFVYKFALVKDK